MLLFRQLGWCRIFSVVVVLWFIFLMIIIGFLRHEPDNTNISERIVQTNEKLLMLQNKQSEIYGLLMDFSNGLNGKDKNKLRKHINNIYTKNRRFFEPSKEYEKLRRSVYFGVEQLWYFINSQVTALKDDKLVSTDVKHKLDNLMNTVSDHKRSLLRDVATLEKYDGYTDWRKRESDDLSNLVQRRLRFLQNPKNCHTARKLVCDLNKGCGYGCQLHHVVYCLIVAYGTERTLILKSKGWRYSRLGWQNIFLPVSDTCTTPDGLTHAPWPGSSNVQVVSLPIIDTVSPRPPFLPLQIPQDLAERIERSHGDPPVWWIGQFLKYLLQPQPTLRNTLDEFKRNIGFEEPIVGIHVRRTDKIGTEAALHNLDEYMFYVEEYFKLLEIDQPIVQKKVYVATDEPKIFKELEIKYPDYKVIGDVGISNSASLNNRYSEKSLSGIVTDIHLLSLTDYLVCTFSSQVCRVAYEIMNNLRQDAAHRYRSLDDIFYFGGQQARYHVARLAHQAQTKEEIDLAIGDILTVAGNHWNGYFKGTNTRTFKTGIYPTFKVVPKVETAVFPKYEQVPLEEQSVDL